MPTSRSIGRTAMETTLDFITDWGMELILELDIGELSAGDSPTSVADTFDAIDGFGHVLSSATEAKQSIPVQPSPQCPTSKKRKRQTPKQEIDRLRLLEYNLTRRLETVQLESHTVRSGDNKELIFWKRLAARQYQQRVASEQENQRLKKLVASRIAHAKRLNTSVLQTIYN
ncbi:hypothetical protein PRNP1_013118 [Phytophthora ramorum]